MHGSGERGRGREFSSRLPAERRARCQCCGLDPRIWSNASICSEIFILSMSVRPCPVKSLHTSSRGLHDGPESCLPPAVPVTKLRPRETH